MGVVSAPFQPRASEEPLRQALEGRHCHTPARRAKEDGLVSPAHTLTEVFEEHRTQGRRHWQQALLVAFAADLDLSLAVVGPPVDVSAVEPDELALAKPGGEKGQQECPLTSGHRHVEERLQILLRNRPRL
jgi:hypothetical protein